MPHKHMRQWRQAVGILGKRGGRFAVIKHGSKLPTRKGWNQTENTISATEAYKHLVAGDNITLACGTGNLYAFDLDADADRGYECAQLAGGMYVHRENAPHKAKFIFACADPIPTRLKSKSHGFDLLGLNSNGTHWSCVIAGTHSSGAPILWGGHNIPVLDVETVAALYAEWTDGEELFAPERERRAAATYADADLSRVADALKHVDPDDMDYGTWIGILAAIHDTFDGNDDALDVAVEWANGKPGEVEKKWSSFDREYNGQEATLSGLFYRARQGGWVDTWLQDRLKAYRAWLASPEALAELQMLIADPREDDPDHMRKLFRNPERARKLLDTILQKCEGKKTLSIKPGYAGLSKESGISKGGIGTYLAGLYAGGFIDLRQGDEGEPMTIELVLRNLNSITLTGEGVQVMKNWNVYREFRADEAFLNNHAVYIKTHQRPALQPYGDNGLGALLALLDGPTTIQDAADLIGYTYGAMARALRRFKSRAMVTVEQGARNRKTYTLKAEWRALLDADRPHMPTYGVMLFRNVEVLKNRVTQLRKQGQEERADRVEQEYKRLDDVASDLRVRCLITAHEKPLTKQERKLKRLRSADAHGQRALHRPPHHVETEAEKWRRKEYAKDIAAAGCEWGELNAWATMEHGPGWWMKRDKTEIIGQYRIYQITGHQMPTMRFVGSEAAV